MIMDDKNLLESVMINPSTIKMNGFIQSENKSGRESILELEAEIRYAKNNLAEKDRVNFIRIIYK